MKYYIFIIALVVLVACKNNEQPDNGMPQDAAHSDINVNTQILRGDYIYYEDVAVLTTNDQIYEVIPDAAMKKLNKQAASFKKDNTDMVRVMVKAHIIPNPKRAQSKDVWEQAIEIKDIMEVSAPVSKDIVIKPNK